VKEEIDFDTFFKQLPSVAKVKEAIAGCKTAIATYHTYIKEHRERIKRLNRVLTLAEAEGGKVIRRPRKKKAVEEVIATPEQPLLPMTPEDMMGAMERVVEMGSK
jgi:hypothetical protein